MNIFDMIRVIYIRDNMAKKLGININEESKHCTSPSKILNNVMRYNRNLFSKIRGIKFKLFKLRFQSLFFNKDITSLNEEDDYLSFSLSRNINYSDPDINYEEELARIYEVFKNYIVNVNGNVSNLMFAQKKINDMKLCLSSENEKYAAVYSNKSNRLIVFINNIKSNMAGRKALSHEFLHMSSSSNACDKNGLQFKSIGFGLNEGYTELLNNRIFFDKNINNCPYLLNVKAARMIEILCGDYKDMENAYFSGNFEDLYVLISNYCCDKDFFTILSYLDLIAYYYTHPEFNSDDLMTNAYCNVSNLIYKIIKKTNDNEKIGMFEDLFLKEAPLSEIVQPVNNKSVKDKKLL